MKNDIVVLLGKRSPKLISLLITEGADINIQDDLGATPLTYAAFNGNIETLELLLQQGARKDLVTHDGYLTAAHFGRIGTSEHSDPEKTEKILELLK